LIWRGTATAPVLLATTAVAVISYAFSRPVPGMGIMMPILDAPLTAALAALMFNPLQAAPLASIGGAGTFDGVFSTGIRAVLLTG
jgi:uncharacterized membrane protein